MLCGLPQYDVKDWEKNTQYPSGRGGHHATTIRNFCAKPPPALRHQPLQTARPVLVQATSSLVGKTAWNHRRLKCHPRMAEDSCLIDG